MSNPKVETTLAVPTPASASIHVRDSIFLPLLQNLLEEMEVELVEVTQGPKGPITDDTRIKALYAMFLVHKAEKLFLPEGMESFIQQRQSQPDFDTFLLRLHNRFMHALLLSYGHKAIADLTQTISLAYEIKLAQFPKLNRQYTAQYIGKFAISNATIREYLELTPQLITMVYILENILTVLRTAKRNNSR